jgi:hypothetical protein
LENFWGKTPRREAAPSTNTRAVGKLLRYHGWVFPIRQSQKHLVQRDFWIGFCSLISLLVGTCALRTLTVKSPGFFKPRETHKGANLCMNDPYAPMPIVKKFKMNYEGEDFFSRHSVHFFVFLFMQLSSHVSHNYYFNCVRAELKGCYNFFCLFKEVGGWKLWLLFLEVELCFYFWMKVHDFLVCLFAYIFKNGVKKVFIVLEVDL